MTRKTTLSTKIEPELKQLADELAKDRGTTLSDLVHDALENFVKLHGPMERGSLVTIPIQVTAKSYGELQMLDKFTDTKTQKLCRSAIEHFLNLNRNALVKIQKFLRVTPDVDKMENPRYVFYQWVRDSWK